MKPASPLPWTNKERGNTFHTYAIKDGESRNVCTLTSEENAAYIAHACNAYPKLVEALRKIKERTDGSRDFDAAAEAAYITSTVLAELGEQS
jgi:hypothetical protein